MPISNKINTYKEPAPQKQSSRAMRLIKTMLSPITKSVNATIDFFVWIFKTIFNFPKKIFNKLFTFKKQQQDIESTKTSDAVSNDKNLSTTTLVRTKEEDLSKDSGSEQSSTQTNSSIPHNTNDSVNDKVALQEPVNQKITPILKKHNGSTYKHSGVHYSTNDRVNDKVALQEPINQKITPILKTLNNIVGDRSVIFNTIFPKDKSLINLITKKSENDDPRTIDIFSQHTEQLMKINILLGRKENFTITYLEENADNDVIIHTAEIKFIEGASEVVPKIELSAISPKNKEIILKDKQAEEQCDFIKFLINQSKEQAGIIARIIYAEECISDHANDKHETLYDIYKSYNVDLKNFLYVLGYFVNTSYIGNITEKITETTQEILQQKDLSLTSNEQITSSEMSKIQEKIIELQEERKTLSAKKDFITVLCGEITQTLSQKTISQKEHAKIEDNLSKITSTLNDTISDERQLSKLIEKIAHTQSILSNISSTLNDTKFDERRLFRVIKHKHTQNIKQSSYELQGITQAIKDLYEQIKEALDEKIDKEVLDFAAEIILDKIELSEEFIKNYQSKAQQIKTLKQDIKTKIQSYIPPTLEEYIEDYMYEINKIDTDNIDISRKIITSHAYAKQEKSTLANIVYNTIVNSLIDLDNTLTLSQTLEEEAEKERLIKELQQAITTNDENTINEIITTLVSKYHSSIELQQENDLPYIEGLFTENESQNKESETLYQEHEEYSPSKEEKEENDSIKALQQAIKLNDDKALHEATTRLVDQYKKTESDIAEDTFYSDTEELNTENESQNKESKEHNSNKEEERSIKNTLWDDDTETVYAKNENSENTYGTNNPLDHIKTEEEINAISTKDEALENTLPSSTLDDFSSTKTTTDNNQSLKSDKEEQKASQPLSTLSDTIADQHESTQNKEKEIIAI